MPELPEVENVRLSLERLGAVGQRFADVDLRRKNLRTPLTSRLGRHLPGQSVIGLRRRAKFLLFETERFIVLNHLGMTGSWRRLMPGEDLIKHDHIVFQFESGLRLAYNDPRRFGLLELVDKGRISDHGWLKILGPEPLGPDFDGEILFRSARGSSAPVKSFIMDQKRVVGVGNIYASEALFRAGIRPARPAGKVTRAEADVLANSIKNVLREAILAGGSTIRDYRNADGDSGGFQARFSVYGRAGEPCVKCDAPVRSRVIGQRSTFWCVRCQR